MEAGTLVEWLKHPGDSVSHGDIIAVVETDKGAIEVEVFEDGQLDVLLVEEGCKVPVGTPLAEISADGEGMAETLPSASPSSIAPRHAPAPVASEVRHAAAPAVTGLWASPAARQLARQHGIDLAKIAGTGQDGAIVRDDVEAVARSSGASARPPKSAKAAPDLAPMRRAIAAAMAKSKREIPHYYLSHRFSVLPATEWLNAHNSQRPPPERLLFSVLLLKSVALALTEFPEFNGFYRSDAFEPVEEIHVGSAISIRGGGLAAPAIHNTGNLTLAKLMDELRDLVARTRRGEFRSSEISDPTVTVSSLGERGVDVLWPVIYPPQVAIFGFGTVRQQPWAKDGGLIVHPVMTASLAADHRANDGHRGALLLRRVADLLNKPEAL